VAELDPDIGPFPTRDDVLDAWCRRCDERSADPGRCSGREAVFLLTALGPALRRGATTPELARAARSWGAGSPSPAEAVASLACLREVLVGPTSDAHRVFDQVMAEAVDGASSSLRVAARTDPMTGCANRLALDEEMGRAVRGARRSGLDVAVAVIDLDGLKRINDTHGHAAGDASILALVTALRTALRDGDSLYRIGGDEFVVVAPFTDGAGAAAMLRRAVHSGAPGFSWGVASLVGVGPDAADDPRQLLLAADGDLYDRRRQSRRRSSGAAARRRGALAASVAASVALASTGAVAVAADAGHNADSATTGSAGQRVGHGTDTGSGLFRWPLAVVPSATPTVPSMPVVPAKRAATTGPGEGPPPPASHGASEHGASKLGPSTHGASTVPSLPTARSPTGTVAVPFTVAVTAPPRAPAPVAVTSTPTNPPVTTTPSPMPSTPPPTDPTAAPICAGGDATNGTRAGGSGHGRSGSGSGDRHPRSGGAAPSGDHRHDDPASAPDADHTDRGDHGEQGNHGEQGGGRAGPGDTGCDRA
jgi:diguanylate cyclase (GGDEF)-like protein